MIHVLTSENTAPQRRTAPPSLAAFPADTDDALFFDRCVDWLLSLYESTTDQVLRDLVTDVLDELREIGPASGEFADVVLGALASVDLAFEVPTAAA